MRFNRKIAMGGKFYSTLLGIAVIAAALVGCAPQAQDTPPQSTFVPQPRDVPTQAPPIWIEAGAEITLANASQISYIGRLDALGTPSTIFAYAFSPDNTRLAGLNNEQLIVWDLITGRQIFSTARQDTQFVFYGADKAEVYTVDSTGLIRIYNADTGQSKTTIQGQDDFNNTVAYYGDQGWLALGSLKGTVKVWDVAARQSLVTIQAHNLQITCLGFSADGEQLATASDDLTIKIWNWRTKQTVAAAQAAARHLVFSPDGTQLAAGEVDKTTLWNTADGKLLQTLNTLPGSTDVLIYSPDNQYVANAGSGAPNMTVWDTKTGALVNTLPAVGGDSTSAAFSPNGDLLVTSVLGGDTVTLWDVSQIQSADLPHADLPVGTRQILYSDWTGDGFSLVLVDATGPIQIWGIPSQAPTPTAAGG